MLGHPQLGYMQRPELYGASYDHGGERFSRERGRMLAELLRRRQAGFMGGQHPGFEGMEGRQSPFLGGHGLSPMMGGHPPPMTMAPCMGMGPGMGPGMGRAHMGMGMGLGMGLGMGGMGMNPHMSFGLGRPPLSPSPYGRQRPSPFGYGSPGPPRAHSFAPQRRRAHLPLSRSGRSHFAPYRMYDDDGDYEDDEYEDEYRIPPPGHNVGGRMRGQPCRYMAPPSRRRGHPRRMFEELEDEYDDHDDYEDGFDDEDGFESLFSRQSPRMWLRGGF
ncbi:hypothetical protein HBH68_132240 [Parastagonospora nodorum]|nr:hypothetical protein HBH68_132240 [Parastagonospora nodorum]